MLVAGQGVARGAGAKLAALRVMPTLLWLAGYPVLEPPAPAADNSVLEPAAAQALPLRYVSSYGPPPAPAVGHDPAAESETREYLRSLGYID